MQFNCKCGSCSIYLKRKGSTDMIGAYCMDCGAWVKWVGKKDVNNLLKQGFIVHPESYVSPTIKLKQDQIARDKELLEQLSDKANTTQSSNVESIETFDLKLCCKHCGDIDLEDSYIRKLSGTHTGVYCNCCGSWLKWLSKKELSHLASVGVDIECTETPHKPKSSGSCDVFVDDYKSSDFDEDYFAGYDDEEDDEYEELAENIETSCDFCSGKSSLDPIVESKVNITYFEGVLSILDENETELLGSYKLAYCPRCGRNLSKK